MKTAGKNIRTIQILFFQGKLQQEKDISSKKKKKKDMEIRTNDKQKCLLRWNLIPSKA